MLTIKHLRFDPWTGLADTTGQIRHPLRGNVPFEARSNAGKDGTRWAVTIDGEPPITGIALSGPSARTAIIEHLQSLVTEWWLTVRHLEPGHLYVSDCDQEDECAVALYLPDGLDGGDFRTAEVRLFDVYAHEDKSWAVIEHDLCTEPGADEPQTIQRGCGVADSRHAAREAALHRLRTLIAWGWKELSPAEAALRTPEERLKAGEWSRPIPDSSHQQGRFLHPVHGWVVYQAHVTENEDEAVWAVGWQRGLRRPVKCEGTATSVAAGEKAADAAILAAARAWCAP